MMDRQPTLAGELVLLRPLREDDREALYAVASDPVVWEQHPRPERWREPAFAEYFASLIARGGSLAVIDRASGELIGTSRFQYGSPENGGMVEIGSTVIARNHWGGGVNRELKRLMIAHALRHVATVEFWAWQANTRSCRALEKIGARLIDRVEQVEINGRIFPHAVYVITRDEFANGPLAREHDDGQATDA